MTIAPYDFVDDCKQINLGNTPHLTVGREKYVHLVLTSPQQRSLSFYHLDLHNQPIHGCPRKLTHTV